MLVLLKAMIKEEWRTHSSLYGNLLFALFPAIIMVFSFGGTVIVPELAVLMPISMIALITHLCFVMMGAGSGAFGLMGREVMNRRFGQASLLAYSSRTLPVSDRQILSMFLIKEVIYYAGLWILPFVLGFVLGSPLAGLPLSLAPLLMLTLALSYVLGLSAVFALSTVYVYSKGLLILLMLSATGIWAAVSVFMKTDIIQMLPTYMLFMTTSPVYLIITLGIVILLCWPSITFAKVDFPSDASRMKDLYAGLEKRLAFTRYSPIMAKDLLDLNRSSGGLGKFLFSLLIPLCFVWIIISFYFSYMAAGNFTLIFALFAAIASSSIYNWFTEYDLFTSYAFFPVRVSTVIKSKVIAFSLFNAAPIALIVAVGALKGQLAFMPLALIGFSSLSLFTLAITVYLGGLRPNMLMYNAKLFAGYMLVTLSALFFLIYLSALNPDYLLFAPILIPLAYILLKLSYAKWDRIEQASY